MFVWIIMRNFRNNVYKSGGINLTFKSTQTDEGKLLVALAGPTEGKAPNVHCQARWLDHTTTPNTGEFAEISSLSHKHNIFPQF
jgi:hypothetical protein